MFGIQLFLQQGSANLLWKCAEKDNAEVRILTLHLQFIADFRKIIFCGFAKFRKIARNNVSKTVPP